MEFAGSETPIARAAPANAGAVPDSDRIVAIDVLRGVAVLGILVMNIQSFAMISMAYVNPMAYGDMTGANYWVWLLSHIFADQKFMTIFSMLFGAGIVLMTRRQETKTGRSAAVHYRRMAVLLFFGLIHAYGLWYGDILVAYALCGMLAYVFRRFRPWSLLLIGCILVAVHSVLNMGFHWSLQFWPPDALREFHRSMSPSAAEVQQELATYRGGWLGQLPERAMASLMFQTFMFAFWTFWRVEGLMLIGMALFKLGAFSATRSAKCYWLMAAVGLLAGVPVIRFGHQRIVEQNWDPVYTMFAGGEYNYWASILVSLGYVGLVMLACQSAILNWLTRPLAAVGRMALSNYLMQSTICTTIFYGHGFGLFGSVERVGQFGIVLAIWAFQLVASSLWLSYFRFGPIEWLWRVLTYWKLPHRRNVNLTETMPAGVTTSGDLNPPRRP